ncbi:MAG TPA: lysylphosphatidylglycerol synthase transmembrane domain-containing protein [Vulgatibacter sp.]|nr:lysylphosphatidylglycerol synthase transmembrane domain-containing protein [Vulgatibacter sp.]
MTVRPPRRKALRVVLAFAASAALLAVVFSQLDLANAAVRFREARPGWLGVAALGSLFVLITRGLRFAILNRHARWPLTTAATAIQVFLNRVTPLRLGELSLPWILRRHAGEDAARSLLSVVLVRLIDLAIVAAAVVAGLALRTHAEGAPPLLPSVAALAGLSLLLAGFRPLLRRFLGAAAWIAKRTGLDRHALVAKPLAKLRDALADGEALGRREMTGIALTSLAVFLGQTLLFGAILRAFSVEVGVLELMQGGAVAQAGAALPIAAVGSFGPQEASWVAGFVWVGVPLQDALVTAIACQVITLAFAALFALPAWLWLQRRPVLPAPSA